MNYKNFILIINFFFFVNCTTSNFSIDKKNIYIGDVVDIKNFGAGNLIEIKNDKEIFFYIPMNNENLINIDIKKKIILVDPIQGLLD